MAEKTRMKRLETHRNIMLSLAYDGSNYHGFQYQLNAETVQQVLENKLAAILGEPVRISGAARTDTGVHAWHQTVSFRTCAKIPIERIPIAMNGILPRDIVILSARLMSDAFHARFSAIGKKYCYRILNSSNPNPFLRKYSWQIQDKLNIRSMNRALKILIGEHDFSAFQSKGSSARNPVRTIYEATCCKRGEWIEFCLAGNGFLYHMVRNIVGTVVELGLGKISLEQFELTFRGRDRQRAGATAPASGLYLMEVFYEKALKELDNEDRFK